MCTVALAYRRSGDLHTSFEHNFSLFTVSGYIIWSISKPDNSRCHRETRTTFGKSTFCCLFWYMVHCVVMGTSQLIQLYFAKPYFVVFVTWLFGMYRYSLQSSVSAVSFDMRFISMRWGVRSTENNGLNLPAMWTLTWLKTHEPWILWINLDVCLWGASLNWKRFLLLSEKLFDSVCI